MMAKRIVMVTIVRPIAISGETSAIVFERSARFSSTSCIRHFLLRQSASTHQQPQLFATGLDRCQWFREMTMKHYGNPVRNFGEFIQILACHQHRSPSFGKVEQSLPDHRRSSGIDAPRRLTDYKQNWTAQNFPAHNEFLQISARQAGGFRVALCLTKVKSLS